MRTIYNGSDKPRGLFARTDGIRRVAAYCRVSTAQESQATSLETQMATFRQRITEREGWELVDVYADEGLSGTSVKRRPEFRRMLADCEAGKIDYIITKSISRFARNTLECLTCIRYLQSMGVQLLFEQENIDTGSNLSEMILTVLAAFAQEESRSISANVTWGIRKRYEAGEERWVKRYGFCKSEDGRMQLEPREAEVVRAIFDMYARGAPLLDVARRLNADGVPSPRGRAWTANSIAVLLASEIYIGDMILQKYRVVDHLTHRSVRNDAREVPSYYITGHHPAIVSRQTFERVQKIRALRNSSDGFIPQYPYGHTQLDCPLCGAPLIQRNTRGNYRSRMALGCFTEWGCGQFALRRHMLNSALLQAYASVDCELLAELTKYSATQRAAQRFLAHKAEQPRMETVEFYWLDDLVERIEFADASGSAALDSPAGCWDVVVHWQCGLRSVVSVQLGSEHNAPEAVAALYWANEQKYRAQRACAAERAVGEKGGGRP